MSSKKDVRLEISSIVSQRDGKPYVTYTWGEFRCQMTPEEAVQHALYLVEAAQAALCDGVLVDFAKNVIELGEIQQAALLLHFRNWRDERAKRHKGPTSN